MEEDSGQDGADHASEKGGDFDQGRVSCALAWPSVPVEERHWDSPSVPQPLPRADATTGITEIRSGLTMSRSTYSSTARNALLQNSN